MCLVADRRLHSKYFRMYDINTSELLFQAELYVNFYKNFRELNDYFYCFPHEKVLVGIQFSNVHDASLFRNLVNTYSFKCDNPGELQDLIKSEQQKLGNPSYNISKPLSFAKKEHAGWDPVSQTFLLNEIPKEIKTLLKKAGFKKKDLKSKETALAIYEILLREVEYDALQATRSMGSFGALRQSNLNTSEVYGKRHLGTNMDDSRVMSVSNFHAIITQQDMGSSVFGMEGSKSLAGL